MNYKHIYHAGNFSDVFKHLVLLSLIEFMKKKDKPFCFLETHAGSGRYDLSSKEAEKTKEYKNGILKLIDLDPKGHVKTPKIVKQYMNFIQTQGFPTYYPGSPLIAESELRSIDRMILMELHNAEAKALKDLFYGNKQAAIHHQDGYLGLKAFLPPKERRGLIFIDPPFEKSSEWEDLIQYLTMAYQRFPTGVYAIWYPLKDKAAVYSFQQALKKLDNAETIISEITIYPEDIQAGLIGCGMAIINPPWQWAETFSSILTWLWKVLSINQQGSYRIYKNR